MAGLMVLGGVGAELGCAAEKVEVRARRNRETAYLKTAEEMERAPARRRRRPPRDPAGPALDRLAGQVGARPRRIENGERLAGFFRELDRLDERVTQLEALDARILELETKIRAGQDPDANTIEKQRLFRERTELERGATEDNVRVLHLGDSHIAADYITRTVRNRFQTRFGNGGRGFVHADQKAQFGGRRLGRPGWDRIRASDGKGARPFGVSAVALISARRGAELKYALAEDDRYVVVHHRVRPRMPDLRVSADGLELSVIPGAGPEDQTRAVRVDVAVPPPRPAAFSLISDGAGAEIFGLSFESDTPGLMYDAIGPVGADATLWSSLDAESFRSSVESLAPALVVIMLGGNDALALRKGRRSLEDIEEDFAALIRRLRGAAPQADCLVFGPMDAALRQGGRLRTRAYVREVVELERRVAQNEGCAFWDAFRAMGGEGSFGRWMTKGLMNPDLVHPRRGGGDLLGHLFAAALSRAYLSGS